MHLLGGRNVDGEDADVAKLVGTSREQNLIIEPSTGPIWNDRAKKGYRQRFAKLSNNPLRIGVTRLGRYGDRTDGSADHGTR